MSRRVITSCNVSDEGMRVVSSRQVVAHNIFPVYSGFFYLLSPSQRFDASTVCCVGCTVQ